MDDPWAAFRQGASPPSTDDPWAAFRQAATAPGTPVTAPSDVAQNPNNIAPAADPGLLANAVRALTSGANPFQDRMVAAEKTILPQVLGGSPGFSGYDANLEQQRAANAQLREQHPTLSNLGQGAGAALSSLAVPAASLGPLAQGTGVIGRAALGSATGAGLGAIQGIGAAPDLTNARQTFESGIGGASGGAALGAGFPAAGAVIGKVVNPLAAALRGKPGPADVANLGNAVTGAYKRVNDLGAAYSPEAYQGLVDKITADAQSARINPGLHPGASGVIGDMQKTALAGNPIDLPRLDQDRQIAWRDAASKPDAGEQLFGNKIRENIDNFIANASPDQMTSGEPAEAATAIQNARDLAMRQFKAKALADALDKAEVRTDVSGTGGNIENATRQRVASILPKEPWSPDEATQLNTMVHGTPVTNALRQVSRLSPVGNALTLMLEGGLDLSGSAGHLPIIAAGTGAAAQGVGALMRRNAQKDLRATILSGGNTPAPYQLLSGNYPRSALAATLAGNQNLQTQRRQNLPQ